MSLELWRIRYRKLEGEFKKLEQENQEIRESKLRSERIFGERALEARIKSLNEQNVTLQDRNDVLVNRLRWLEDDNAELEMILTCTVKTLTKDEVRALINRLAERSKAVNK